MTAAPGLRRREIRFSKRVRADDRRGLGELSVTGRINQGDARCPRLACLWIARRRFAVERQAEDLPKFLVWILRWRHALAIADRQEQILTIRRKGNLRTELSAFAFGHLSPDHLQC